MARVPMILFDLDDTLVDRQQAFDGWASGFMSEHGLKPSAVSWLRALDDEGRTPRDAFWRSVRDRLGLPESVQALVARWGVEFPALYACEPETLAALHAARAAGCATGIVTNGDSQVQARKIESARIGGLVDTVCISDAEGMEKPDPGLFALAARRLGQSAADGWMVGDNPVLDIAGGMGAGLQTAWLRRGRTWPSSDKAPTMTVDSVLEAVSRIIGPARRG
jgi:FMN phosphatase YigB (HAD superfamily)